MEGDGGSDRAKHPFLGRCIMKIDDMIQGPVDWVKNNVVDSLRSKNKQYYYHRRFRRVPTIDECYMDDPVCMYEAQEQFKRDKMVDANIVNILRQRKMECMFFYGPDSDVKCKKCTDDYELAAAHYFGKYGDLGATQRVVHAYMKQKHQMLWERRHQKSLVTGEPLAVGEE